MKNILVKLFLELIVEERRGPPLNEFIKGREVCDPFYEIFYQRLGGTTHYIKDSPDCIRLVMDKLNEIGLSDESIIKSFNAFINDSKTDSSVSYKICYEVISLILNKITDV